MRSFLGPCLCLATAVLGVELHHARLAGAGPAAQMAHAARDLMETLDAEERARASFSFDDPERTNWHYVPRARAGLAVSALDEDGSSALRALLVTLLGEAGWAKVERVRALEAVLFELESRPGAPAAWRDRGRYWISIFGEPSADAESALWGWRFEGHHVSINATVKGGEVSATPFFLGAHPATVRDGPADGASARLAGQRTLAAEEDLGRALARALAARVAALEARVPQPAGEGALDELAALRAFRSDDVPADVLHGPGRPPVSSERAGLEVARFAPDEEQLLRELLLVYFGNLAPQRAEAELARVEEAGLSEVRFLWAGSLEPGQPHYYRVEGLTFALECANVSDGANHVHALWRDTTLDFGGPGSNIGTRSR